MAYEPLHHKYRPQTFADLVGQTAIAATLSNAIEQKRIAPAYLFTGPRGTGKTSSARILAKSLNCVSTDKPTATPCGHCVTCSAITKGNALDVIEIDAASNTGVDNIREIIERAQFAPVQCRYKVYVIDECHMLSTAAFNALLKTLEEPPERVVFVLATTDPQRVLPTIISRCQRFDYRRIPLSAMTAHLGYIATQENITISDTALTLVAQIANGGLRDAESLLDQLSLLPDLITPEKVWDLVGAVPEGDLLALLEAIAGDDPETLVHTCRQILNRGREPLIVLQNLAAFYLGLLIAKTASERSDLVSVTEETWQNLVAIAPNWPVNAILQGQQKLKESEFQLRNSTQPRLWLEVTLLGLLPSALTVDPVTPIAISKPTTLAKTVTPSKAQIVDESVSLPQKTLVETPSPSPTIHPPLELPILWEQVMALLVPFVKTMVQTHCSLEKLEGNIAQFQCKEKAPITLLQSKVADLETAFKQVCQRPIQVQFIGSNSPNPKPPTPNSPLPTPKPPTPNSSLPTPKPPTPNSPLPNPKPPTPNSQLPTPNPPTPIPDSPQGDTQKAIEQFAKNFKGEIVATEGEDPPPSEKVPGDRARIVQGRPTLAPEEEDDLPF